MIESEQPLNDNEQENQDELNNENNPDWTEIIKAFLGTEIFERLLLTIENNKKIDLEIKKIEQQNILENKNSERQNNTESNNSNLIFWKWKFAKELLTVFIIIICVVILACFDKIESDTLGTLLGSVIGYSIGNFSSSNKN